jgi:pyrophosphatase PpaX
VKFREAIEVYRKYNIELHRDYVYAYPGVLETLRDLKAMGYHTAIVSNKLTSVIKYGLEICYLENYIDVIVGSDIMTLPKPDPNGIFRVLNYFKDGRGVMVGDTSFDIMAAKNAGLPGIGVTWCKTTRADFEAIGADFIVDHMEEIKKVLELIK